MTDDWTGPGADLVIVVAFLLCLAMVLISAGVLGVIWIRGRARSALQRIGVGGRSDETGAAEPKLCDVLLYLDTWVPGTLKQWRRRSDGGWEALVRYPQGQTGLVCETWQPADHVRPRAGMAAQT